MRNKLESADTKFPFESYNCEIKFVFIIMTTTTKQFHEQLLIKIIINKSF